MLDLERYIAVIGLGYVGWPLFTLISSKYKSWGLDANTDKLHRKEFVIASSDSDKDGYAQLHDTVATGQAPYITPSNKNPVKNISTIWLIVTFILLGVLFIAGVGLLGYLLFVFKR